MEDENITSDPLETPLGKALLSSGTSNDWSTCEAVANKIGRKLGRKVTPRELDSLLLAVGNMRLNEMGVWRTSFGAKYMPIICVNPSFGRRMRAYMGRKEALPSSCTCGVAVAVKKSHQERKERRYFGSHDYNAGRHASTKSAHRATCPKWTPSITGHLHSWRRGFTDGSAGGRRKAGTKEKHH